MNYENLSNEELLKEVYLTQHKDRLLTLVCERLEMAMRELDDARAYEAESDELAQQVDDLHFELGNRDEEVAAMEKRIDDLESRINFLTDDDPEF